jgi:hypothetical protein
MFGDPGNPFETRKIMNQEYNPFYMTGYLVQNSDKPPASPHEAFAKAVTEHTKTYTKDGTALLVFAAPSSTGNTLHFIVLAQ